MEIIFIALLLIIVFFLVVLIIIKYKSSQEMQSEIEDLKRKNNILRQYNKATKTSNIISNSDLKGNITYVNDKFCEVAMYTREEIMGKPHNLLRGETDGKIFKEMWETIQNGKVWKGNLKNTKKDGSFYYINTTISPIFDENGKIFEYVAIRHEITDLVQKTNELNRILREDYLTGIGNRYKLIEDISKKESLSIALLDIKNFSELNDLFGYQFGDMVLKLVARKIDDLIKKYKNYSVYRVTSDVFAILAQDVKREDFIEFVKEISLIVSEKPFSANRRQVFISLAYCFSFEEKSQLLESVNIIRKYAKKHKNHIIYDKNLNIEKEYENNIYWTQRVKTALEKEQIIPFFQGIYNLKTQKIEKYEALARLKDDNSTITPYFFLDISKKSGQYKDITKSVIEKSFEYFKDKDYEFSINLAFEDILDDEVKDFLIKKIEDYNIGSKLVVEIVESEEVEDFELLNEFLELLSSYGCKIAIDDFGSGYSNFEYLTKMRADYIKIDGSLIKDILDSKGNQNIVSMIIGFAKEQGFKTIAEFVWSKEIFDKVEELGVDYIQGYYISEPKENIDA
ncbi:EAL domain-containing protein [Aliarcobacter skirrowii]|uniref:bifunctional diguanylate cyclase/phosphodiesterase n=1 Tax=Aliarcobacter skirrowii TaxID=28200 RepID=UPI0029AD6560|nr:EAL domain-containing protein [Aliarcobacter skirrowii]MDX4066812.1 EAL domain-containing protein [Aliarcobacter skirrowii]